MQVSECIGCKSPNYKVVGDRGLPFDTVINGKSFFQPEYQIRGCNECSLLYKSQILSHSELESYYREVDPLKWDFDGLFPTEELAVRLLSKLPQNSNILDFGCGTGRLMSRLLNRHSCFGVEVNRRAAEIAASKGIKIVQEDHLTNSSPLSFDAILLSDVFEHLIEPRETLSKITGHLRQGGILLIITGNADAKACKNDIANFWYFRNPEHICMLSRKHAEYLAAYLNLTLIYWTEISHYRMGRFAKFKQHLQNFAYWQFHNGNKSLTPHLLRIIPKVRKAEHWEIPPALTCTNDHVVVGFQK